MFKEYLGDGVYAEFDGYQVWLSTQEGHHIALEPSVFDRLCEYVERLQTKVREQANEATP